MLSNVALFHRKRRPRRVSHYNAMPVIDIYASVQGTDLGFVSKQVSNVIEASKHDLPRGAQVSMRGQVQTMNASFNGLLVASSAPSCSCIC